MLLSCISVMCTEARTPKLNYKRERNDVGSFIRLLRGIQVQERRKKDLGPRKSLASGADRRKETYLHQPRCTS